MHTDTDVRTQPTAAAVATARHRQEARAGAYSLHVAPWTGHLLLQDSCRVCECRLAFINACVYLYPKPFQQVFQLLFLIDCHQSELVTAVLSLIHILVREQCDNGVRHLREVFHLGSFYTPLRLHLLARSHPQYCTCCHAQKKPKTFGRH